MIVLRAALAPWIMFVTVLLRAKGLRRLVRHARTQGE
jgi:hypothetical protein